LEFFVMAFPLFGSDVPYAEPAWYRGQQSTYYTQSHVDFRAKMRKFVNEHLLPNINEWEEACVSKGHEVPAKELARAAVEAGVYAPSAPAELGGTPPEGGFDAFHDLIWVDEIGRCGAGGLIAGLTIWTMALPPVMKFGTEKMKKEIVPQVIRGEKNISLCISEPTAGSDVAGLKSTAVKQGDHFVLNGTKKWITWATHADYFTVACRTGAEGRNGVSLLLVDRHSPGVTVRRMKLQGNWLAGTCHVSFEDVKVPVENVVGKENEGFKAIMMNFNHERFVIAVQALRMARLCIQDAVTFARARKTFGTRLIDHQVIRHKIAEMARLVECSWSQAEQLAYQMKMGVSDVTIGGPMALLKVQASRTVEYCAREASQIIGGSSYTREGKGQQVERIYREVRSYAIPGGSEEIMMDLAMRMAKL